MFHTQAHKANAGHCIINRPVDGNDRSAVTRIEVVCDFRYVDYGKIIIFTAKTLAAQEFGDEHLADAAGTGQHSFVVEHSYFATFVDALDAAGLTFAPGA